jgi:hypothetical protein
MHGREAVYWTYGQAVERLKSIGGWVGWHAYAVAIYAIFQILSPVWLFMFGHVALQITASGYNHKLPVLLNMLIDRVASFKVGLGFGVAVLY